MRSAGRRATRRAPDAIAAAGAEPYVGDPDRIGTLMDALHAVTILVLAARRRSPDADLHGGRLRMLFEKLVDTPVRGVVYERRAAGGRGDRARRRASAGRSRVEIVEPGRRAGGGRPPARAIMNP